MDEIAGYFPPVANPPSKAPLLTLMKQARAFGVGVLLGTQNTVDIDYKGLSNAGTWFLGRLQTERDKARVLDGLEGAAAGAFDRAEADRTLSALGKRVFVLHDVHEKGSRTFQTRWSMSYLRGPLSRDQIRVLMDPRRKATAAAAPKAAAQAAAASTAASPAKPQKSAGATGSPPVLPPGVKQLFVPGGGSGEPYQPVALGAARIAYADTKLGINESRDLVAATAIGDGAIAVDWTTAELLDVAASALETTPPPGASFEALPRAASTAKNYADWQKAFASWLTQAQQLELWRHSDLQLTSKVGESERDFRIRVQNAQREARDGAVEQIRQKFAAKRAALEEKLRRAQQGVTREQQQVTSSGVQTAVSIGATVLGAFFGRKAISAGTIGRATTAARGLGRSAKEYQDVRRAEENADVIQKDLTDLDAQITEQTKDIAARFDTDAGIEKVALAPKRGQVTVQFVALGWRVK
jgi:hypothetical protein